MNEDKLIEAIDKLWKTYYERVKNVKEFYLLDATQDEFYNVAKNIFNAGVACGIGLALDIAKQINIENQQQKNDNN